MIRNIIFDFGKVLVDYDYNTFLHTIFDSDEEVGRFYSVVCSDEFIARCDLGEETFPEIVAKTQEQYPEWRSQLDDFRDRQMEVLLGEVPGMRDLLNQLRARGFKLYGLTNWSAEVYQVIAENEILQMLDGTVVSSDERIVKPDLAIFRLLCDRFGLVPDECLFTDDKPANVEGALKAGLHAVLFTGAAPLAAAIDALVGPSGCHCD